MNCKKAYYLVLALSVGMPGQLLAHSGEGDFDHHGMMGGNWGFLWDFGLVFMWMFWGLVFLGLVLLVKMLLNQGRYNGSEKKKIYVCSKCGHEYESLELARKCQGRCSEYDSSNPDVTKHSNSQKK